MLALLRQFAAFFGVGLVAALVHYSTLVIGVEMVRLKPVPATLAGYVLGGVVSYALNRHHTYASDRPHSEAGWRFAAVAGVGFLLTFGFMHLFVERMGLPYLPMQIVTTGIVLVWSFVAHKIWTFGDTR
ncbi:MAG TPA: GtrA family protein [Beijerinckiaceae bacterium]|nr:GtrA family protein [Beijerinckiaceae bacterium]